MLQRRLSVGYARAARIMDQLQSAGVIVGPGDNTSKGREVLIRDPQEIFTKEGGGEKENRRETACPRRSDAESRTQRGAIFEAF